MKDEDHLWLPHKNLVMWFNLERIDEIFKRCCDVQNMTDLTVIVVVQYFT